MTWLSKLWLPAVLAGVLTAAQAPPVNPAQEPPEEDEALVEKEYSFNPLQADKELKIGNFYFKKGSYRAAVKRFEEAARWEPTKAEAFYRLAEAHEKLKDEPAARKAFEKFLELESAGKRADSVRKKLKEQGKS